MELPGLRAARLDRLLTQRELAAKAGLDPGHRPAHRDRRQPRPDQHRPPVGRGPRRRSESVDRIATGGSRPPTPGDRCPMTQTNRSRPGMAPRTTTRAAIYHRVSSEEQVEGYSLDAQDRATRAYCEAHGWIVAGCIATRARAPAPTTSPSAPTSRRMLADAEAGLVRRHHRPQTRPLRPQPAGRPWTRSHRLGRCGVGFVSISENMDFATPIGQADADHARRPSPSTTRDNLSAETSKGKAERKAQGIYNGLLPFGVKKNSAGIPVPDPETYPGLLLAFRAAAEGKSDRDVAEDLNAAGYRTTGNRGRNPFTKDTVCRMLQNRFYLGELPDGDGRVDRGRARGGPRRRAVRSRPAGTRRQPAGGPGGQRLAQPPDALALRVGRLRPLRGPAARPDRPPRARRGSTATAGARPHHAGSGRCSCASTRTRSPPTSRRSTSPTRRSGRSWPSTRRRPTQRGDDERTTAGHRPTAWSGSANSTNGAT